MNKRTRDKINRANAQHSTGPKTPEGKQRCAMNALKHGLTGHNLMIQEDELEAYDKLTNSLFQEHNPQTGTEEQLVQQIIHSFVKLNRAAAFENNVFSVATVANLTDNPFHDDATETIVAQTHAWLDNENSFDKLGRYTSRISRDLIRFQHELEHLQGKRKATQSAEDATQTARQILGNKILSSNLALFCETAEDDEPQPPAEPESEGGPTPAAASVDDAPATVSREIAPLSPAEVSALISAGLSGLLDATFPDKGGANPPSSR